ncbi:hypothetical protein Vadar_016101 [Vaccinium darrowii]|uniref:Uncharacterized protein n=1 Tax=Vaccinium darrowii TaxID=229202 RepID=A0ACB7XHU3_9ERIC|nr:hypothetical protein Vadar_016101 [Vaccinium darrowii]
MLNGEDLQLLQETTSEIDNTTVLMATQSQNQGYTQSPSPVVQIHVPLTVPSTSISQQPPSQSLSVPTQPQFTFLPQQQQYSQNFRNSPRGRGNRRFFREPCAICGRNNHVTDFCYYKSSSGSHPVDVSQSQWRSGQIQYAPGQIQYAPGQIQYAPWVNAPLGSAPQFIQGNAYGFTPHSTFPQTFASPYPQLIPTASQYTQLFPNTGLSPSMGNTSIGPSQMLAQVNFTGTYAVPTGVPAAVPSGFPSSYGFVTGYTPNQTVGTTQSTTQFAGPTVTATTSPANAPQRYFDSGATHHVTNSLQNLQLAHPATQNEGIVVGNGSQLPVTHTGTGQEHSSSSVSGTMSQGPLPYPELI